MVALEMARAVLAQQPFSVALGARLEAFGDGEAVLELDLGPQHRQQFGFAHGGVICYAADNAITFAAGSVLGAEVLTGGLTVNYVRPARAGTLRAHAEVVREGRNRAVCTATVSTISDGVVDVCAVAQGWVVTTRAVTEE